MKLRNKIMEARSELQTDMAHARAYLGMLLLFIGIITIIFRVDNINIWGIVMFCFILGIGFLYSGFKELKEYKSREMI